MAWDDNLTVEQRAAAAHHGAHARLIAGPGTGKTLALTRRAEYLVTVRGVAPDEILLLTFTRAAAAELRERLRIALGAEAELPRVSTLHSFALRQLLRNPEHAQIPMPIRVADDYEERWIVEQELGRTLRLTVPQVRELFRHLANDWERLAVETPGWEDAFGERHPRFLGAWREHREIYGYTLRSELVYQLKVSLERADLRIERPRHLLVDEYQDLNACDLAIITALSRMGAEVYGAGDDDQSIYGFRFAVPDGIRNFPEQYPGALSLALRTCHRCGARILDAALFVAQQDPRRLPKILACADGAPQGIVQLVRFGNETEEARGVARICRWLVTAQGVEPRRILILFRGDRGRAFSTPIREQLLELGIPATTETEPLAVLDEGRLGRQLLALLRLTHDREDGLAWHTLLRERPNGVGAETLARIYDVARERGQRFGRVLEEAAAAAGPRRRVLEEELAAINGLLGSLGQPAEGRLEQWLGVIAAHIIPDAAERNEVLGVLDRLRIVSGAQSLEQLLRSLGASLGEFEQEASRENAVALMTMHQAKGLTADAVVIVAAEREYIPGRAISGSELDDARRLLYVSMTRARRFLYMTFCDNRLGQQRHTGSTAGQTGRHLTPFLERAPAVLVSRWENLARTLE